MLAAVYDEVGPADVLRVEKIARPEPGPGEVRVKIAVSGVNPTDYKNRSGLTGQPPDGLQIPHQDGTGVVDAVGDGVDPARIGQRVWVYFAAFNRPWGTAAEWSVVPQERAVPLPDGVSDELGAMLGIPAVTAHHCVFSDGPVEGRTILVAAGAGAVGHMAIELAVWGGARVIATASGEEKSQLARAAGADEVILYREGDALERLRDAAPAGVDRVVEVALDTNLDLDLQACAPGATIVTYADSGGEPPRLPVRALMTANLSLRFVLVYTIPAAELRAAVAGVGAAIRDGALTPLPVHRYGLERVAEAHRAVEAGVLGKVLVDVGAPSQPT
jgi:NADPH2:quinone reductase